MPRWTWGWLLAPVLVLVLALPAQAQSVQPWPDLSVSVRVAPKWTVSGEVVERVSDSDRASQLEVRAQVGYALGKRVTLGAGYVHYSNYNPHAPNTHESVAVEQLGWKIGEIGRLHLTTRTRLEQRFIEHVDATSWRVRQQLRLAYGLGGKTAPSAILWTEPFIGLNRTRGQTQTLDQLRSFAGLNFPVTRRFDLEIGYLNQRLYRTNQTLVNDCIPLIFSLRL